MRYSQALREGMARLAECGLDTPRLDAEVLLRHVLGLDRALLYAHLDDEMSASQWLGFQRLLASRSRREPVAYLVGHREFYGLDWLVDRRVLVPRPETELLVEEALRCLGPAEPALVAEVGTGSGAVAVSIAVLRPQVRVYAIDSSPEALAVAAANRDRHAVGSRVTLLEGDLLEPLPEAVDLLVANLPYIPTGEIEGLEADVRDYEPRRALDGGPDGLDLVRRLLAVAPSRLNPGGVVLLEIGAGQGEVVCQLATAHFPRARIQLRHDLAGQERVVKVLAAGWGECMGA